MKLARLIHPGFWFDKTPLSEAITLAKKGVGGFCIYGGTREQIKHFTQSVRAASPTPLLISADYEDGLGRWVSDAELLPSNLALGAANDENLSFEKGLLTARQAKSLGVDWVFAPVVDLADNPLNPIVNTRSFGEDSSLVTRLASAFMKGLSQGGVLNSLKHFPGHGDTQTDSHLALPLLNKTLKELRSKELIPFQQLLPFADSVMIGHLLFPHLDPDSPASLSKILIGELLQKEMGFTGCVITDALLMKALGDEKQAAWKALQAGAHILLAPEEPFALLDFLEEKNISQEILSLSEKIQIDLCQKASQVLPLCEKEAFAPNNLAYKTAQKALVQTGTFPILKSGEEVHYIEVGHSPAVSAELFLNTLIQNGIQVKKWDGKADKLMILCFRRYQAFQGKIALEEEDVSLARKAAEQAKESVFVAFASPWAAKNVPQAKSTLLTFSPASAFQILAAKVLLGEKTAEGTLPFSK